MFRDREQSVLERSNLPYKTINDNECLLENVCLNSSRVPLPPPCHVSYPWEESHNVISPSWPGDLVSYSVNEARGKMSEKNESPQDMKLWRTSSNSQSENYEKEGLSYDEHGKRKIYFENRDWAEKKHEPSKTTPQCNSLEKQCYEEISHANLIAQEKFANAGNPVQRFELSDKNHSFDDQTQENIPESPVTGRIPSPSSASSIASGKRLEWDSGADVGYNLIGDHLYPGAFLSTVERIALARGCSAALFERLDPEGTSGPPKPVLGAQFSCHTLDSPVAKSTPLHKSDDKMTSRNIGENPVTPIVEQCETVLPGGYLYLHSGEEFDNNVASSPQNGSSEQEKVSTDDELCSSDNLHKKHSNSLIDLSSCHEEIPSSVPRSQSYLNILNKENNETQLEESSLPAIPSCTLAATCSVSSSSVATIVQKPIFPKTSNKLVQTLPLKLSVGVQVSENVESPHSFQKVVDELQTGTTLPISAAPEESKVIVMTSENKSEHHKCGGAHKKGSIVNRPCHSYQIQNSTVSIESVVKENDDSEKEMNGNSKAKEILAAEKEQSTLDSVASSSQTAGSSYAVETSNSGVGIVIEGHRGSVVDSANSFEYLPGHVFENAYKYQSHTSKQSIGSNTSKQSVGSDTSKQSLAFETSKTSDTSDNKSHSNSNITAQHIKKSNSQSTSLFKDIEEGVEQLQKLMSEKSYNNATKKKLIRQIVNKLVNTEYSEDHVDKDKFHGIPLSSNVPWVPATADMQYLKTANAYKNVGAGDWNNKSQMSVQNSSKPLTSERTNDKMEESVAVSEVQSSPSIYTPSGSVSVPGDNEQSLVDSSEVSSNIISDNVQKDWKIPTSRTETVFETSRMSSDKSGSSSLLHLCKSEHEKQLQWIRFEIDHLSHLKQLLEKQEKATKILSNLVDHEHQFHKINPPDKKTSLNKFQRSKEKRSNNSSKITECSTIKGSESSQHNAPMKAELSSGHVFMEQVLPTKEQFLQTSEDHVSHLHQQEKIMRKKENKHTLSMQPLTFDSYVVVDEDNKRYRKHLVNSSTPSSSYDGGRLNVFVQTSPNRVRKHENVVGATPLYSQAFESAKKNYVSAMRCFCECRCSRKEILLPDHVEKKVDNSKTYCKCMCAGSGDAPEVDYSFDQSASSVSFPVRQSSVSERNTSEPINVPQKRNIATETVVNKSVQTSSSLSEIPLIKPVWDRGSIGKGEQTRSGCQKEDKFCPCCGLLEMSLNHYEEQPSFVKFRKQKTDLKNKVSPQSKERKKHIRDASVQTTKKDPLAYLLTFEPTCKENVRTRSNDSLPEIKLLVPVGLNKLESDVRQKSQNMGISKENQCPEDNVQTTQQPYAFVSTQQPLQKEKEKKQKLTLQEYLRTNRPDYIQHADKRSQCLADLALLRELRKQKRLELMAMTDKLENIESKKVPSDEKVVFTCAAVNSKPKLSTRAMREQSRRKYHRVREMQNKLVEKKKKEDFRTNRLMAELFTKKLQKKTLEGVVNHSNSASVISSVL